MSRSLIEILEALQADGHPVESVHEKEGVIFVKLQKGAAEGAQASADAALLVEQGKPDNMTYQEALALVALGSKDIATIAIVQAEADRLAAERA